MKERVRPIVMATNGCAVSAHLEAMASIKRGLAEAHKGFGRPADEVFDELERQDPSQESTLSG
jgi:hypothetical protein